MNVFKLTIYILSLVSLYAGYLYNESSELQYILYNDMGQGNYLETSTSRFDIANFDFPNISQSAIPMKAIAARYYFYGGEFDRATEMLHDSRKANPYMMFNEGLLGEIYNYLQVKDSALYYNEKAFNGLRYNGKHFIELSKSYVRNNSYAKLDSVFDLIKDKKQPRVWVIYFSSLLTGEEKISPKGKIYADEALQYFSERTHTELMLAAKYVKYGTKNIMQSLEFENEGSEYFDNQEWIKSANAYKRASMLNPGQYSHKENAGIALYKFGYYEEAISYLKVVVDSLNPKTGKSEFILAETYSAMDKMIEACDFIRKSIEYNYRPAFTKISEYCK
jgi:hypothetical protein